MRIHSIYSENFIKAVIFLLGCFALTTTHARELTELPSITRSDIGPHIIINDPGHPIKIQHKYLDGAIILGGDGESVILSKSKFFSVGILTSENWPFRELKPNNIPAYIFTEDFKAVTDQTARAQAKGISRNLFNNDHDFIGKINLAENMDAYIAFSRDSTTIMIASESREDFYTHIVAHGLSWKEIQEIILNGVER